MQTDNTLILADKKCLKLEETDLIKARLMAKPKLRLSSKTPLTFNGCLLTQLKDDIMLFQKEQGRKLKKMNIESQNIHEYYIEQRALAAYIASICQPEATIDMSVAAQHKKPDEEVVKNMN